MPGFAQNFDSWEKAMDGAGRTKLGGVTREEFFNKVKAVSDTREAMLLARAIWIAESNEANFNYPEDAEEKPVIIDIQDAEERVKADEKYASLDAVTLDFGSIEELVTNALGDIRAYDGKLKSGLIYDNPEEFKFICNKWNELNPDDTYDVDSISWDHAKEKLTLDYDDEHSIDDYFEAFKKKGFDKPEDADTIHDIYEVYSELFDGDIRNEIFSEESTKYSILKLMSERIAQEDAEDSIRENCPGAYLTFLNALKDAEKELDDAEKQRVQSEIRQKENESAADYRQRVSSELAEMVKSDETVGEAVQWIAEIQLFLKQDTVNDEFHQAAKGAIDDFKESLYGATKADNALNIMEDEENLKRFAGAAGKFLAEERIKAGKARSEVEQSISSGEVYGTELVGAFDEGNEAVSALSDAVVGATNHDYQRAEAFNSFWGDVVDELSDIPTVNNGILTGQMLDAEVEKAENRVFLTGENKKQEQIAEDKAYFERGKFKDTAAEAEKYGYEMNPDAYIPGEKLFYKIPADIEYAMNADDNEVLKQRIDSAKGKEFIVNEFRAKVDAVADEAALKLEDLESKKKKGDNSPEYKAMKASLEKIAGFKGKSDYTADQVVHEINRLKTASDKYTTSHDHWYKAKKELGRHRKTKSIELSAWAEEKLNYRNPHNGFMVDYQYKMWASNLHQKSMNDIVMDARKSGEIFKKETENRKLIKPEDLVKNRSKGKEKIDYHKKMTELRAKGKNGPAAERAELNGPNN